MAAVLLAVAMLIGCFGLSSSGPLWPDGAQYANAGAMFHDLLSSGAILSPYEFAKQNYARYPAFHLPYHPPVYPALLGVFFLFTGVSYTAARIFIALCLWASGCFFNGILRRSGVSAGAAFGCSLLLLTTPQIAFWSRDSMSEIPGLALVLAGTYCFVRWLASPRYWLYAAAFVFAEAAFLSRFLTAGVVPAWFLLLLSAGQFRRLRAPSLLIPPAVYGLVSCGWVVMVRHWARYETGSGPVINYAGPFSWKLIAFYAPAIPSMVGWTVLSCAIVGLVMSLRSLPKQSLWLWWIASYSIFIWGVGIYSEERYLFYLLPVFPALAAPLLELRWVTSPSYRRLAAALVLFACFVENVGTITAFPRGVVGYETVGKYLAGLTRPGNILVYSAEQAHLIFQYRASEPMLARSFIRGDRTLAVRAPAYTAQPTVVVAQSTVDVVDIIRRGRIRYIVTSHVGRVDEVPPPELTLLQQALNSRADLFRKLSEFPLRKQYSSTVESVTVSVWEYTGVLRSGPSEIPIQIPTADMTVQDSR